ncbi:hypothetical protein [Roseobacter sinensis]|uniref:Uncharacterized protein n=1 Tax=Roseobacter sinensis TaxID=2931391 RepID=A0ABT3B9U3_9RHOB|nr:hypothetical protein [Roseobacter sp. WL0113]MCV3270342.1 hypothetical protein [Roseobacter sp. WL0113]
MTCDGSGRNKRNAIEKRAGHPTNTVLETVAQSLERSATHVQDHAYDVATRGDIALVARLITLAADLEGLAQRARRMQL